MYIGNDALPKYAQLGVPTPDQFQGAAMRVEPNAKTEVASELDRLANIVDQLAKTAEVLGDRLRPVRRPTGALAGSNQTSAPEPVLCDVASAIRSRRQQAEHVLQLLHQSLNELEI